MTPKRNYTPQQYRRFKKLVELAESQNQVDRITARFEQPKFIKEVGKEICDEMFARLCAKEPKK